MPRGRTLAPRWVVVALVGSMACGGEPDPVGPPGGAPVADDTSSGPVSSSSSVPSSAPAGEPVRLDDRQWLVRTSLAIRGVRPSIDELDRIAADPSVAEALVDDYLASDEFLDTVRDLHADLLLLRTDGIPIFPALGPLEPYDLFDIYEAFTEEPLQLIAHIVDDDRPYTDIVTSDTTYTNEVGALMWGLPYDESVGGWQSTRWTDGRPLAGILSSSKLWLRYESAGSNFHRGRANAVADKLLCAPFDTRDIVVEQGVNIIDEEAVAESVKNLPECVACHQALDPLAGYLWGFKPILRQNQVGHAYTNQCDDDFHDLTLPDKGPDFRTSHYCYPLTLYSAGTTDDWDHWGLRAPGYFGKPAEDLADVGRLMADDPRFSRCAVKNFAAYLHQVDREEVPEDLVTEWQAGFEEASFNVRSLVKAIVLSEGFRTVGHVGDGERPLDRMLVLRPEALAQSIEHLTGFRWVAVGDPANCATLDDRGQFGSQCWGPVDLGRTDRFGYHAMGGGTDSFWVPDPTHSPTPLKLLAMERFAWNAAGYVVDHDLSAPVGQRRLLVEVEPDTTDEAAVRSQLARLHYQVLSEPVATDDPLIDEAYALFADAHAATSSTADAWKLVVAATLLDPRMMFY